MPLSIALYFIVANAALSMSTEFQLAAILAYTAFAIAPLFILKLHIKSGKNVIEVQKWRVQNKAFARIISGGGFLVLGLFILSYWVM